MIDSFVRIRALRLGWALLALDLLAWAAAYALHRREGVPASLLLPVWALAWTLAIGIWRLYFFERADKPVRAKSEGVLFAANLLLATFVLFKLGPGAIVLTVPVLAVGLSTLLIIGNYLFRKSYAA